MPALRTYLFLFRSRRGDKRFFSNPLAKGLLSSRFKPESVITSLRNKLRIGGISSGVPGGIRTPNLLIRSQLLYPVELQTPFRPS
jgi:hypothetical protein